MNVPCCAQLIIPVQLFETLWAVALQAHLFTGFPRQEYCSGLPCPPPGYLTDPGSESASPVPCIAGRFLTLWATWKAQINDYYTAHVFEKAPFEGRSIMVWTALPAFLPVIFLHYKDVLKKYLDSQACKHKNPVHSLIPRDLLHPSCKIIQTPTIRSTAGEEFNSSHFYKIMLALTI